MCDIDLRIKTLRNIMAENNIAMVVVPTNDYHMSEYVGDYFKTREYITGFSGSAGTAVISKDKAILWTDGRYYIQAANELENSEVILYKAGLEGVPTVMDYICNNIEEKDVVAIDGRCVDDGYANILRERLAQKKAKLKLDIDVVGMIWDNRPKLKSEKVYELDIKYTGEKRYSKLMRVRKEMIDKNANYLVITSLDDIAWLLNLRGNDIQCNPVFFSYFIMTRTEGFLFVLDDAISEEVKLSLEKDNIRIKSYFSFYNSLKMIEENENVMLD